MISRSTLHKNNGLRGRRLNPKNEKRQIRAHHKSKTGSACIHAQSDSQQIQPRTSKDINKTDVQNHCRKEDHARQNRDRQT